MNDDNRTGDQDALDRAQKTIAQQAAEIQRLRERLSDERFAADLREALALATTVGTIGSPVSHDRLLEMIVETATRVISARASSLFLINAQTQELEFAVALGQKAAAVRKFTVPLGHGIAGLVAVTGQPMAVSDASSDPRHAADISRSVGYTPNSILCVPLYYNDQVIGVLELLDKEDTPSFTPSDIEILSLFANLAAVSIEQSRTHENLASLVGDVLQSLGGVPGSTRSRLDEGFRDFASRSSQDETYKQNLHLARLVHEIIWRGENEAKACQALLDGFAQYLRARSVSGGEPEVMF